MMLPPRTPCRLHVDFADYFSFLHALPPPLYASLLIYARLLLLPRYNEYHDRMVTA